MVSVTVVLCTKRDEPQFGWALESLKNQTYTDFEYLIIDGYYDVRKDEVIELIKSYNLPFPIFYMKDKPSRWKGKRPAICNARNTALIFANGKYIVSHDDNCKMPPDWLDNHLNWLKQGYLVTGSWIPHKCETKLGGGPDTRLESVKESKIVSGAWFYSLNASFPLNVAIDINGFDEELDGGFGLEDISFGIRAERKGYIIMYDPSITVDHISEFHTRIINSKPKNIPLNNGILYPSNNYSIQKLVDDSNRILPYGNKYDLSELRTLVEKINDIENSHQELEEFIDPNPLDWRDNENISDI